MRATFIETSAFTVWVSDYLPDEALSRLQLELMENPEKGDVIPGCGGLRKVRVADPGRQQGKRSGVRVIYLHQPEWSRFFLISIYGKGRKEDLSAAERKTFAKLARQLQSQRNETSSRRKP